VDVIGVNSYYKEQISDLNRVNTTFDSLRPYLISEFGPSGYWTPIYNRYSNGLLAEETETEKANWLKYQWNTYVKTKKGYNIGGVAYCWHDRMEGSLTWFGLSDYKGRLKPGYYSLCEVWAGKNHSDLPQFYIETRTPIETGKECTFKAISQSPVPAGLTYEWVLHKDSYLEKIDNVKLTGDERTVVVKMPDVPADYTLYLYVSDDKGNVTTAASPFRIKKK
jgi:cellulose synthase (UDP-forming)